MRARTIVRSLATLAGVLTGCAQAADTDIAVSIAPASAIVKVADGAHANPGTQKFVATVSGSEEQAVLWEICHGATCYETGAWNQFGSIGLDGVFTAPLVLPNPTTFTIKATPVADPDKSA